MTVSGCGKSNRGITPAYAGKSYSEVQEVWAAWDHPRLCGEKRDCTALVVDNSGITPAYAGKREDHARSRERAKDHPRLCGEKQKPKDF